ncbi:MAG: TolC family protein [Candidatus Omnitrophica bacterium]|nr:TolC family protein [Candidatus Omnitrophota bacterium]
MVRVLVLVAVLLMRPFGLAAEEPVTPTMLTLADAVRLATTRYAEVLAANERTLQALARLGQARATLWPHLDASASQFRQTRNLEASGIPIALSHPVIGPFNSFDARIGLTQTLFDVSAFERFLTARAGRQLSLAQYEKAKQDAMALVAALFLEAVRAAQAIEPAHALLTRDQRRLEIASTQHALGLGSDVDVQQAQADVEESHARWQSSLTSAYERQLDVIAALHLPMDQPLILVDEEDLLVSVPRTAAETQAAAQSHPDVVVAQRALTQRTAEQAAERTSVLPTIKLSADYGASGKTISESAGTYTVGASVALPIFAGGQRLARIREAESRVREGHTLLDDVRQQAEVKALRAVETLRQSAVVVKAQTALLQLATTHLMVAQRRLRSGLGSELDVVDAQTNAMVAKDHRADAIATYRMAQVTLAHAMGHVESLARTQFHD